MQGLILNNALGQRSIKFSIADSAHKSLSRTNFYLFCIIDFINPRRACAARVTVVGLSFCLSVCLSGHAILAVRAIKCIMKDTIVLSVRFAAILKWSFS